MTSPALKLDRNWYLKPVNEISGETSEVQELLDLLKWNDLPDSLIHLIEADLKGFADEMSGNCCTNDPMVRNRRHTVVYWVDNYLKGVCSYDTAYEMLKVDYR